MVSKAQTQHNDGEFQDLELPALEQELSQRDSHNPKVCQTPAHYKREFSRIYDGFCNSRDRREVFADFVETAGIWMHNSMYAPPFQFLEKDDSFWQMEQTFGRLVKKYGHEGIEKFGKMSAIIHSALSDSGGEEFLGTLYEELEIMGSRGKQATGEFFTPYALARMMARMNLNAEAVKEKIDKEGFITVYEPACGAGVMIVAVAERLNELGFNPREHMVFVATDISRVNFNMTYTQLSMLGLKGIVRHGNSISNEMWEVRPTTNLLVELKVQSRQLSPEAKLTLMFHALTQLHTEEKPDDKAGVGFGKVAEPEEKKKNTKAAAPKTPSKSRSKKGVVEGQLSFDFDVNVDQWQ
jgi:N-6 DNA Methylase